MSSVEIPPAITGRTDTRVVPASLAVNPVRWWAFAGGAMCAFMAYVMIRWVTGPYFQNVPTGPTPVPEWMKVCLIAWQIVMPTIWLTLVWVCVIRPWRREKRMTADGLILLAGTTVVFQDPMASYFNHWLTYNSYLVNRGSWVNDIPGWMSYGEPGRMLVEPPLFIPFAHGFAWILFAVVGSRFITWLRARWPGWGMVRVLISTYAVCFVMDVVLEGIVWMPFGIFTFPGGHLPALFPDSYHRFPLNEPMFFGAWCTGVAFLYHFRNDRGEMIVERGIDRISGGPLKRAGMQLLAVIAVMQVMCMVFYNIPQAAFFTSRPATWPTDHQERSYFTNGLCGAETPRACPGPGVPLYRGNSRNQNGLQIPPGGELPDAVPFKRTPEGPFDGPLIRLLP